MQHCVATKSIAIAKMLNIAPLELTTDDKLGNDKQKTRHISHSAKAKFQPQLHQTSIF